jgi:hypothetical protein
VMRSLSPVGAGGPLGWTPQAAVASTAAVARSILFSIFGHSLEL